MQVPVPNLLLHRVALEVTFNLSLVYSLHVFIRGCQATSKVALVPIEIVEVGCAVQSLCFTPKIRHAANLGDLVVHPLAAHECPRLRLARISHRTIHRFAVSLILCLQFRSSLPPPFLLGYLDLVGSLVECENLLVTLHFLGVHGLHPLAIVFHLTFNLFADLTLLILLPLLD